MYPVFGLLDLYRASGDERFLVLAEKVGRNMLESQFQHGFFVRKEACLFARLDEPTPLALLHLVAARREASGARGGPDLVPAYRAGNAYFHCPFKGMGRTTDSRAIYRRIKRPKM